ncbi:hypothetical protein VFPPC_15267 [Pochonia chlamydosporia 170]|uniref:Uncharacterized protein n=1 Tax=Pochonia chlamydosporia 170 TaxID=1380566 RepID=A0A179G7Q7_METCM|nr:hypothetical protein VFPPC_15267 [Pochonia chlamydosporia 170]OAQ73209.1 hypothetical protein VFPPC_15267 [Pochonia chlamydosporia 170]
MQKKKNADRNPREYVGISGGVKTKMNQAGWRNWSWMTERVWWSKWKRKSAFKILGSALAKLQQGCGRQRWLTESWNGLKVAVGSMQLGEGTWRGHGHLVEAGMVCRRRGPAASPAVNQTGLRLKASGYDTIPALSPLHHPTTSSNFSSGEIQRQPFPLDEVTAQLRAARTGGQGPPLSLRRSKPCQQKRWATLILAGNEEGWPAPKKALG